jgi:PilZ domain-containing protein
VTEAKPRRCAWVGCADAPTASLEKRSLCAKHFLELALRRLDAIEKWLENPAGSHEVPSDIQGALSEMLSQVPTVVTAARGLSHELREKFVALSEKAANLYKRARRPPRFDRSVSCHIRLSVLSSETPQKCATVNVSQRGASVETTHAFQRGQAITLQREDTGKRAKATVVWVKKHSAKRFTVGLAITDQDDFWGLEQVGGSDVAQLTRTPTPPRIVKHTK